ncbi:MAG: hypothetical protein ACYDEN_13765 [Acidimicrobiales bacterium]
MHAIDEDGVVRAADAALYRSKHNGRDRRSTRQGRRPGWTFARRVPDRR